MPPRLSEAAEKTRRAAQVVRDQFALTSGRDDGDARTPQTRRSRRGARRGGRRGESRDDASVEPVVDPEDRAAIEPRDTGTTRQRARRAVRQLRSQGARLTDNDDGAADAGRDTADETGGGGRLSRAAKRAREAAQSAVSLTAGREGSADDADTDAAGFDEQRQVAAELVDDKLDETSVSADDVRVIEDDGGEARVRLTQEKRTEIAEQQVAERNDLDADDDFNVRLADDALQNLAAGNQPDFDVELTPEGREKLTRRRVEEQGGIETRDGEFVEVEPDELEFDERGRARIEVEQSRRDGGLVGKVAEGSRRATAALLEAVRDEGAEGSQAALATSRPDAALFSAFDGGGQSPATEVALGANEALIQSTVGAPATADEAADQARGGLSFAFESTQDEGAAGLLGAAALGTQQAQDTATDVVTAAEERPFQTAGALAAPVPGPRGRAALGGGVGSLSRRQQAAAGGLGAGVAGAAAVSQSEVNVPDEPAPGLSSGELSVPEDGTVGVREPEVPVPEAGEPGIGEPEVAVPESGGIGAQSEADVPDDGRPGARQPEVPVPDAGVTAGLNTAGLFQRQRRDEEAVPDADPLARRRERRKREERREILQGPDEEVVLGTPDPAPTQPAQRQFGLTTGVISAGVVGGSATADGRVSDDTGSGSEVFDAAFGAGTASLPPGEALGLTTLTGGGVAGDLVSGALERQETAATPAPETATTAGLTLTGPELPQEGTVQQSATDSATTAATAADAAQAPDRLTLAVARPRQQALSEAAPLEAAPAEPTAPATEPAPAFVTEPPVVPGGAEPPRRPPDDDGDDDDDDRFAPPQIGEAATPFVNPIVGGPQSFGVAGGSLFASDGGGDGDGDGGQRLDLEVVP